MGEQSSGETFVPSSFSNWKRIEKFQMHVGGVNSSHNQAWRKCQDLLNLKQSIEAISSNGQTKLEVSTEPG